MGQVAGISFTQRGPGHAGASFWIRPQQAAAVHVRYVVTFASMGFSIVQLSRTCWVASHQSALRGMMISPERWW
jgi:hypothetical protein